MENEGSISASCTWGDGPDVLVTLKDFKYGLLLYEPAVLGYCENGSICLTAKEAKALATQLLEAVRHVEELEKTLEEYMEHKEVEDSQ